MRMKQLAYAIGLIGLAGISVVHADDQQPAKTEKIEVTGSSIKRIAKEGALPVTTLSQEDIKKSAATSASDLLQMLPNMQGFVPASSSINGEGAGATTAALHALPSKYTLVLLDGQRLAPTLIGNSQGGGFAVNLESIPIEAVERVEILTDGASALYGSDAIAGVVNFITKKNKQDGNITFRYTDPQHPGGNGWNTSITKGWGNLDTDGFNVMVMGSHDQQSKLEASQRFFSKNGALLPFSYNGQNLLFNNATDNTEPANISFSALPAGVPASTAQTNPTAITQYSINPFYAANGNCGPNTIPLTLNVPANAKTGAQTGVSCRFNYAETVQDLPQTRLDSGMLKGSWKLNDNTTLWSEFVVSRFDMPDAQYAAPAQPMPLSPTQNSTIYNAYVLPYLQANNLQLVGGQAHLGYRAVAAGGRADDYKTLATDWMSGINGSIGGWDYNATLTISATKQTDIAAGGYTDYNALSNLISSGAYNPVNETGLANVPGTLINGQQFTESLYNLNVLHLGAQHDLFDLPGGTSVVAFNGEYQQHHYRVEPTALAESGNGTTTQPVSSDYAVGGPSGDVPVDASRNNWGVGAEWLLPVYKTLEVTLAARYDSYQAVNSSYNFSPVLNAAGLYPQIANGDIGNTFSDGTYKASFRWTPLNNLLVRGSYGTGFKAPNISDIVGPVVYAGSTSGSYNCPFPNAPTCLAGQAQYDLLAGGNGNTGASGLKPEKSTQWTIGFRYDPIRNLSLGLDLWNVKVKNQVESQGYAEQVAFNTPQQVPSYLWVNPYVDPFGNSTIGFEQIPFNGGVANYQGVDWDFSYRANTAIGKIASNFTGTEMLKQNYTDYAGGPVLSDLGAYGPDQQVVFRTQAHWATTLARGPWANTITFNYKSGYHDATPAAGSIYYANGPLINGTNTTQYQGNVLLDVASYTTIDWQTKYDYSKAMSLTFGIKNIADHTPPFTLQVAGGGNQVGYDGRYADPLGRTFYLSGSYNF